METTFEKRILKTFSHMKSRCYNPADKRYADWGGRGISICSEWLQNPYSFVQWSLDNGYKPGLAIDRIDNNGNYCPNNCRWITLAENNQNRRSSKFYTYNGKTLNLEQWCKEYGVSRPMINKRLEMGWPFEKALTEPKKERDCDSLIGKRFGRLTVVEFVGVDEFRQSLFNCECDCGQKIVLNRNKLKTGHTSSCGCYRKEQFNKNICKRK